MTLLIALLLLEQADALSLINGGLTSALWIGHIFWTMPPDAS